jgi:hypothetical protein
LQSSPLSGNGSADASGRGSDLYASNHGKPRGNACSDDDDGSAGAVYSEPTGDQRLKCRSMATIAPQAETHMLE